VFRLSQLLTAAGVGAPQPAALASDSEPQVTRVDYDSRSCRPGSIFVAITGFHADGHNFAAAAVARGAVAVVGEQKPHPSIPPQVPLIIVADSRVALSALAAVMAGNPSRDLCVAGITGTDGKTTTATLLWSAWRASGINAGALTTTDWRAGDDVVANPSRQTTLEAVELQQHLRDIRERGCTHVALETSSHGLQLHRVDDVEFRCAVYTRITTEHLELHGTRDAYFAAKASLLERVSARLDGIAVLDADDEFAFPRLAAIPVTTRLTYSVTAAPGADLIAMDIRAGERGMDFTARTPWGDTEVALRLAGRFNVANALGALAAACATGATLDGAAAGLQSIAAVPGRMESIELGQPFRVVVDYAHTAESLRTVLHELRETTRGRLWVVFGSAGERDAEKRPAMGAVAAELADVSVITDEDPREEDRYVILEQIAAGATAAGGGRGENVVVMPDRDKAIDFAIANAAPGDTVLLAGKGHEASLITGRIARPWNEREVAAGAIRRRLS
jgi:UDP-N-acetylmuramoyl-L-alanyl-D-glutamate--2,6-diaminopimelate ligase